ncbi:MotA/TolQ/ExbB proton channel family protein [candidate division KSB1 bacterium]
MNLLGIVAKGGWLMIPIIIFSIIAAALIIERFVTLRKSTTNTRLLMKKLKGLIMEGDFQDAVSLCNETPGPTAKVLREGIERSDRDKDEIKEAIESAGKEQVFYLERYLGVLATIAGVAPLTGFLGTVTGMIDAFMEIERQSGNVNASVLAGGIWEALMTTAAGLIVGILTFIFYNYFVTRVQRFVFEIESNSNELLELLINGRT